MTEEDIKIPKELAERIGKHAEEAGFDSVSDYVTYILRQVVEKLDKGGKSTKDEKEIEKELKTLGYLG